MEKSYHVEQLQKFQQGPTIKRLAKDPFATKILTILNFYEEHVINKAINKTDS